MLHQVRFSWLCFLILSDPNMSLTLKRRSTTLSICVTIFGAPSGGGGGVLCPLWRLRYFDAKETVPQIPYPSLLHFAPPISAQKLEISSLRSVSIWHSRLSLRSYLWTAWRPGWATWIKLLGMRWYERLLMKSSPAYYNLIWSSR